MTISADKSISAKWSLIEISKGLVIEQDGLFIMTVIYFSVQ